jgi:hypothetical protein
VKIVPKESAVLGLPDELNLPVNACHREICRFANEYDTTYMTLITRIKEALEREGLDPTSPDPFPIVND